MTLTPESAPNLIQPDFALAYDSAGNVGTITHSVVGGSSLATFSYAYDAANRLTHETNAEGSVTYTYDNTNQLTSATGARSESYAYDANGNRNATGYTVGTGGTLSASPNATYTYDAAGHVTAKTDTATGKVTTFSYDYRDRLTGATRKTSGGVVDYQVTYTYDALNRRIGEQIDADGAGSGSPVQTWTVFDGENPYADFTGSGTLKDRYLYGPAVDALLARTDASGVTDWYLADRLGSVRDIVDVSGSVVYHTGYDSFGNNVNASGTGGDRFGFTGREHDAALNLYCNRARFYDPATGRFLSRDPIGFEAGDANLYRYVNNSPITGSDPSGLEPIELPPFNDIITQVSEQGVEWAQDMIQKRWLSMIRESDAIVNPFDYINNDKVLPKFPEPPQNLNDFDFMKKISLYLGAKDIMPGKSFAWQMSIYKDAIKEIGIGAELSKNSVQVSTDYLHHISKDKTIGINSDFRYLNDGSLDFLSSIKMKLYGFKLKAGGLIGTEGPGGRIHFGVGITGEYRY